MKRYLVPLAVMAAIGAIPSDALERYTIIGELALDGTVTAVAGALPAAVAANARGHGLICPAACGPEAAWASSDLDIIAPRSLIQLANHFKGTQVLTRPKPGVRAGLFCWVGNFGRGASQTPKFLSRGANLGWVCYQIPRKPYRVKPNFQIFRGAALFP